MSTLSHPFLEGRKYRQEELAELGVHKEHWRHAFWAMLGLAGFFGLGCLYLGSLPRLTPYYIHINDATGETRVVGEPRPFTVPNHLVIKRVVSEMVQTLRAVPADSEVQRVRWEQAYVRSTKEGRKRLDAYKATWQPMQRKDSIEIKVLSALATTATSWDVRWQETVLTSKRELLSTAVQRGLFTVQIREPQTKAEMDMAPEGVFFHEFTWSTE